MPRTKPSLAKFSWDATTERLLKAANDNFIETDAETDGAPVTRRRVADWPLARLKARGLLDDDPRINDALADAGELYYAAWYHAGLAPLGAIDYGKVRVDCVSGEGTNFVGLGSSDFRLAALERYRRYSREVGDARKIVEAIVCHGQTVGEAANDSRLSSRTATRRGIAALKSGLHVIAEREGLLKPHMVAA